VNRQPSLASKSRKKSYPFSTFIGIKAMVLLSYIKAVSENCNSTMTDRILYVRLPCNPIFPIGVVYLSDHVHKIFPDVEQRIFDLGTVPPLDFASALDACVNEFKPTLLVYSWRDIQIYAPVGGRGGNPLLKTPSLNFVVPWEDCE
jgi:hypothetical protein